MIKKLFVVSLAVLASFAASAQTTVTITVQTPDSVRTLYVPLGSQITFSQNPGQSGGSVTLNTPWWSNLKPLINWIDNESYRNEPVGQAATDNVEARIFDYYYLRNFTTPRVEPGGVDELMKHGRYSTTGKTPSNSYYVYKNGASESLNMVMTVQSPTFQEKITSLVISHAKNHPTEANTYDDWIATGMENRHCGDCSLPAVSSKNQPSYSHHGMHLFASVEEAREYVMNTPRTENGVCFASDTWGEGQYLVDYHSNLCLNDLVETHFSTESGLHGYFPAADLENLFYYRFSLTSFQIGGNNNDESQYACLITDASGKTYLHPLNPNYSSGTDPFAINYDLENWNYTTAIVANHIPLVRVELVSRMDERVIDFGYIPIRILGPRVDIGTVTFAGNLVFDGYETEKWSVSVSGGNVVKVFGAGVRTTIRQTELDLLTLGSRQIGNGYPVLSAADFNAHYRFELNATSTQQYLVTRSDGGYSFSPVQAVPLQCSKIGDIYCSMTDYMVDIPPTFEWTNITLSDVQALSNIEEVRSNGLQRAVKLVSDNPMSYPPIFVIFKVPGIDILTTD